MRHPDDGVDDQLYFRAVIGRLWAVGVPVQTEKLWKGARRRVPLPTYAFQHARYWIDPGVGVDAEDEDAVRPERIPEVADWFRAPRWIQQGVVDTDEARHTWLVFRTDEPVLPAIEETLRSTGHRVVSVRAGDTFARIDETTFTIAPEAGGAGYEELVEALEADELLPDRILHGWLLTWGQSYRPGSTFFHRNQEYGFYSLFHLARALGRAGVTDEALHLTVLANGAQGVAGGAAAHPDKATALGPCAVLPREFPALTCRFVDLESEPVEGTNRRTAARVRAELVAAATRALEEETSAAAGNGVVAWRDGVRWERHLRRVAPAEVTAPLRLRKNGVYLLTGGFGGIAGVIGEWLARELDARLVLLGRTPLPARDDWDDWLLRHGADDPISCSIERVRSLEALGATVLPVAADVTIAEQMREVLERVHETFGAIQGVFHTAGVLRDNLVLLKSQREIEEVFSAKVYGTLVLDQVLADEPLDFMTLFSSTSLFVAPQGQIDYVGANAFLNAYATAASRQRPWPVTALSWGIWRDVGMVGDASAGSEDEFAHATEHACAHPLLDTRHAARAGTRRLEILTGRLSPARHWILDEHRLASGEALLPGTGYIELIRAGLEEFAPGTPWELQNLVFEDPFFVEDGASRPFRLRFEDRGDAWAVTLLGGPTGDGPWSVCANARVVLRDETPQTTVDLATLDDRLAGCAGESASGSGFLRTRQEAHLRFGPRWQVLRRLRRNDVEALAELRLAEPLQAETAAYGIHPGLLDIATGCAMDLIPGYAEQEVAEQLWVPLSYRRFVFHAPLGASVRSWIRIQKSASVTSGFAAFDVTLTDPEGTLLAEVEGLTVRRMDGALRPPAARAETERSASPGEVALRHNRALGITAPEGVRALGMLLRGELPREVMVSSLDPGDLVRQQEAITRASTAGSDARFARPELDSEFEAPRNDVERGLADLWGNLLGVEGVGIHDSFFDLGGHSLVAVRLFNEINERFGVDLPMSVLMQHPTIAGLSELLGVDPSAPDEAPGVEATGTERRAALEYEFLVPMHSGPVKDATPLFVVAGMFGNVLNLGHLAHLLGEERPFYAVQARGLYGDKPPHETFEEMARDYLAEIRRVQPHGPYLLGGFSGGGIAAFEMARQLIEAGEEVGTVILLDTPIRENPGLSFGDRAALLLHGIRNSGIRFLMDKVRARVSWELRKRRGGIESFPEFQTVAGAVSFQSEQIGQAFLRALARYRVPRVEVRVDLFRPRLDVQFEFRDGRRIDRQRAFVREDNFWTDRVGAIGVHEVPGDHDSMVLEPNVRLLVAGVRRALERVADTEGRLAVRDAPARDAHATSDGVEAPAEVPPLRRTG
jgi:thioesterase domain-containing protein/acyl transferase domain-containing protein